MTRLIVIMRIGVYGKYLFLHSVYLSKLTENGLVCRVCILLTSSTWKFAGCNAISGKMLPTGVTVHQEFKHTHSRTHT